MYICIYIYTHTHTYMHVCIYIYNVIIPYVASDDGRLIVGGPDLVQVEGPPGRRREGCRELIPPETWNKFTNNLPSRI